MEPQRAKNDSDILTIRMSRRSVQDNLDAIEESLAWSDMKREQNPNYPSEAAMFAEFPHFKEQLDAYRTALAEDASR